MGLIQVGINEYYTLDDIKKCNANWNVIFSERSAGKSYSAKKEIIDRWLFDGQQGAIIRRYDFEINQSKAATYWNDIGDYFIECAREKFPEYEMFIITAKTGAWHVKGISEEGERKDLGILAYYYGLNKAMDYKSYSYPGITTIVMEEFMTTDKELFDEFDLLLNLISTIKRKRTNVKVYLLGNTINRNNKILCEMGINVRDIKQGEIKMYSYYGKNNAINTVAVEYPFPASQDAESEAMYVFNRQQEAAIINGEWQTKSYKTFEREELFEKFPDLAVCINKDGIRLYVYMNEGKENYHMFVSDERMMNRCDYVYISKEPTSITRNTLNSESQGARNIFRAMLQLYSNDWVKYKDNLVGCDFEKILADQKLY